MLPGIAEVSGARSPNAQDWVVGVNNGSLLLQVVKAVRNDRLLHDPDAQRMATESSDSELPRLREVQRRKGDSHICLAMGE